jgi:hypothetical protein
MPSSNIAGSKQQGEKNNQRAAAAPNLARRAPGYSRNSLLDPRRSDARTAENGFATSGGLSKSAQSSARRRGQNH